MRSKDSAIHQNTRGYWAIFTINNLCSVLQKLRHSKVEKSQWHWAPHTWKVNSKSLGKRELVILRVKHQADKFNKVQWKETDSQRYFKLLHFKTSFITKHPVIGREQYSTIREMEKSHIHTIEERRGWSMLCQERLFRDYCIKKKFSCCWFCSWFYQTYWVCLLASQIACYWNTC